MKSAYEKVVIPKPCVKMPFLIPSFYEKLVVPKPYVKIIFLSHLIKNASYEKFVERKPWTKCVFFKAFHEKMKNSSRPTQNVYYEKFAQRVGLFSGGSLPGSRNNSRPASRQGSKPPSRHGSNLSLDSTGKFPFRGLQTIPLTPNIC